MFEKDQLLMQQIKSDKLIVISQFEKLTQDNNYCQKNMQQGDQHSFFEIELISQQLICPLTQFLLTDPVMIQTGHTFDRQMIQGWFLRGNKTNPATGLPLQSLKLYPNIIVKNIIKKLPIVEKKIRNKAKQIQGLLKTLEEMWNNQTPLGISEIKNQNKKLQKQNETLKAELMHKEQQKLLQKMELQVAISSKDEKIEELEKSNKYLKGLVKRQTDLRRVRDQQIQQLGKQLARITLQAKQALPSVENKADGGDFSPVLPTKENKSCEHGSRKSPRQGKNIEKAFKEIPHFLKQSTFSQYKTSKNMIVKTKTDRQQKYMSISNEQEQESGKKQMKNTIYTGKNVPKPPLAKPKQKLVKQMSKELNTIKRERQSLKTNKVTFI